MKFFGSPKNKNQILTLSPRPCFEGTKQHVFADSVAEKPPVEEAQNRSRV